MNNSGTILIRLVKENKEVMLQVIDEGIGISETTREKLGEPFHSAKENGTGLGLMVTNNIIKNNHQGSIRVESQVNQGTTFTIKLPIDLKIK
jgi:signal transduction histidine kinase